MVRLVRTYCLLTVTDKASPRLLIVCDPDGLYIHADGSVGFYPRTRLCTTHILNSRRSARALSPARCWLLILMFPRMVEGTRPDTLGLPVHH